MYNKIQVKIQLYFFLVTPEGLVSDLDKYELCELILASNNSTTTCYNSVLLNTELHMHIKMYMMVVPGTGIQYTAGVLHLCKW